MATTFDFTVSCEESRCDLASRILDQAHHRVATLECELSEFLSESPVFRLNHARPLEAIVFSHAGLELLTRAQWIRGATQGAFNCEAKGSLEVRDANSIQWDQTTRKVWRNHPAAHLSFGAIGKGYAIDQVRLLLVQNGFENFILSAGGSSILISGFADHGDPWRWAWSWKKDEHGNPLGISLSHSSGHPIAIGVSGTHEKGEHIVKTRATSEECQSALVAIPSATDADALSTALFVSGWRDSMDYLKQMPIAPALACVDLNGTLKWNSNFQSRWGSLDRFSLFLVGGLIFTSSLASAADETVDLSSMGLESFTPYVFERSSWWAALPLLSIALVAFHLKKIRKQKNHENA